MMWFDRITLISGSIWRKGQIVKFGKIEPKILGQMYILSTNN